eukprot:TRINITY_DN5316_c0_g2_i1.p1 TRINITY_DN5316_c0_g2~~TRINITY_DN5316_c0_g2_i1.p1  ORF type:complete len:437 (-),score=107.40 TRINITY_DN5316_c0_g2_i1:103-1320(-)
MESNGTIINSVNHASGYEFGKRYQEQLYQDVISEDILEDIKIANSTYSSSIKEIDHKNVYGGGIVSVYLEELVSEKVTLDPIVKQTKLEAQTYMKLLDIYFPPVEIQSFKNHPGYSDSLLDLFSDSKVTSSIKEDTTEEFELIDTDEFIETEIISKEIYQNIKQLGYTQDHVDEITEMYNYITSNFMAKQTDIELEFNCPSDIIDLYMQLLSGLDLVGSLKQGNEKFWIGKDNFDKYSLPEYMVTPTYEKSIPSFGKSVGETKTECSIHPKVPTGNKLNTKTKIVELLPTTKKMHPWLNIDGSINVSTFSMLARKITEIVLFHPGIVENQIYNRLDVYSKGSLLEFLNLLKISGVIYRKTSSVPKIDLFYNADELNTVFGGELKHVYYPTNCCMTNLSLLINKKL